jgi:hypothetical protein
MASKYSQLLLKEIAKKKGLAGTMPADMRVIKQVLEQKFAEKAFAEGLVNELLAARTVILKMK